MTLFRELDRILQRPKPFEYYTSPLLWDTAHFVDNMLEHHLDPDSNLASPPQGIHRAGGGVDDSPFRHHGRNEHL
ncbi:hypothetical protein ACFL5M_00710 [Candidatus Neomarinimicrobiota bacterium]